MTKVEYAKQLRECTERKYNCSQAVLLPFAKENGLDEETAYLLAAPFQGGMKIGATCGAITGGFMALGLLGTGEEQWKKLIAFFSDTYGSTNCSDLIQIGLKQGNRKEHCNRMIYEAIRLIESMVENA